MNEALKVIEAQLQLVHDQLKRLAADPSLNDKSFAILNKASIDVLNLNQDVQRARGWNA